MQGCNCAGGYGAGFSGFIADIFPRVEAEYRKTFDALGSPATEKLGTIDAIVVDASREIMVINAYTQLMYRKMTDAPGRVYASLEAIENAFWLSLVNLSDKGYKYLFLPKIGAGLGGLDWQEVERVLRLKYASLLAQDAFEEPPLVFVAEQFVP